jgi:hypothetical protein
MSERAMKSKASQILETTTTVVKSGGLQRARAQLDDSKPEPDKLLEPTDPLALQVENPSDRCLNSAA